MEKPPIPCIIYAERLGGGVVIAFDDGRSAIYPAALLHAMFSQANELKEISMGREELV
jgi:hypothetical protein